MMEERKRRKFTPEFKAEAVKQVLDEKRPASEVAKALGIQENLLSGWVERTKADRGEGTLGALTSEERAELAALRREVKTLRMEPEILKGATACFVKGTREVRVHLDGESELDGRGAVSSAEGEAVGLLRVAATKAESAPGRR